MGTKRARTEDLKDPFIPFDQSLKLPTHDSRKSTVDNMVSQVEITVSTYSSSASPPPPPLAVEISLEVDEHDMDS